MGRFTALPTITDDSALGGSTIVRSVRLDGVDGHFKRTPSANGNQQKFTFSLWVKRSKVDHDDEHFMRTATLESAFRFDSLDRLHFYFANAQGAYHHVNSSARFREIGAWYHCVAVVDTTHATSSSRIKIYINGEQITILDQSTYPKRYEYTGFNQASSEHKLGAKPGNVNERLYGYLAEVHLIDGQALDPSYFGYTEPQTRIWRPKKYTGNHANVNTNAVNDGSTWSGGSAKAFNNIRLDDNANQSHGEFTGLNGSLDVNFSTGVTVNSSLVLNLYGSVGNTNNHVDVFINDVERTITVEDAYGGSNSGDFAIAFTGTMNKITLNAKNSANNGLGLIIVDGEILQNGYNARGNNSFYLPFTDNSGVTATTIGRDHSGNGNNFTPTNIATSDSVIDTPTDNFVTLNPLERFNNNCTLSDGNLKATGSSEAFPGAAANIELTSGKWYYEFVINTKVSVPMCGVCQNDYFSGGAGRILYRAGGHYVMADGSEPTTPDPYDVGDIIGVAIDLDDTTGNIRFYKNGTLQTVHGNLNGIKSSLSISTKGGLLPYIQMYTNDVCTVNFGQLPFSYTPPSGHRKLTSNRILKHSTPSILDPEKHFECLIYPGDDHNYRDITGLNFTPDFVWIKNRSQTDWHILSNSIVGMQNMLYSNTTSALNHDLNSNGYINKSIRGENGQGGFSVNAQGSGNVNENNENYVAWSWKGGSPNIETPSSGSVFFAVDNNYLDLGSYTDFQFGTGDYTIEMFVYHIDLGGQQTYVGDDYGDSAGVYFYKTSGNKIAMYYSSGNTAESSSTTIDSNKWVHVAASRSSGTLKLFQDGVEVGSGSDSTNLTATQLCIGDTIGGSSGCMHGYISNVRVLKGTGLYTSNFTPPTSPLTNITNTKFLGCQSETVAGLASVHPSTFSNNGTNYSSGSQMSGDILADGENGGGGKDSLFDGKIGDYNSNTYVSSSTSANTNMTWTPTSSISYSSKVEVWCYSPNGYGITVYYTLNGGSEQTLPVGGGSNFNNQAWCTLATGSGTITSINMRITRPGSATSINWGAIRVDGSILVNDVTGKVVTPTMDNTHSVPPSPKNPFDGEFAVDGTRFLTAASSGLNGGTITLLGSSINTKAGFSMIEYAGTDSGSSQTIPHGLNEPPVLWMWKNLTQASDWVVYTTAIDGGSDYLLLNDGPAANSGVSPWSTLPTSSVVTVGTNNVDTCNAGDIYIMYAWHSVPGYSKIGRYTGNGSSDGPYVEIGFKPALVIIKRTDSSTGAQWLFLDNKRNEFNPLDRNIYANLNNDDGTAERGDFLANGFKLRNNGTTVNASGGTYIYMAFAEKSGNTPYQTEITGR